MSLFATKVMVFSLLASAAAFAQAGDPSASRALQTRTSQDSQTIKITRSGERFSTKAQPSTSQVPQVLIVFSPKILPRIPLVPSSLLSPGLVPRGTAIH